MKQESSGQILISSISKTKSDSIFFSAKKNAFKIFRFFENEWFFEIYLVFSRFSDFLTIFTVVFLRFLWIIFFWCLGIFLDFLLFFQIFVFFWRFLIIFQFLDFFFNYLFSIDFWWTFCILLNVTKATTKSYHGYYWTPKMA